eukprot:s2822_g12.t1
MTTKRFWTREQNLAVNLDFMVFAYRRIPGLDYDLVDLCASPQMERLLCDLPGRLREIGCEQGGAASEAGNVPKQHFAWEPTLLHLQLADAQRAQLFGVLWGRGVWAKTTMPMSIATELLERRLPCEAHIRLGCEELEASHAFCGFLRSRALLLREFRRAHYMLNHGHGRLATGVPLHDLRALRMFTSRCPATRRCPQLGVRRAVLSGRHSSECKMYAARKAPGCWVQGRKAEQGWAADSRLSFVFLERCKYGFPSVFYEPNSGGEALESVLPVNYERLDGKLLDGCQVFLWQVSGGEWAAAEWRQDPAGVQDLAARGKGSRAITWDNLQTLHEAIVNDERLLRRLPGCALTSLTESSELQRKASETTKQSRNRAEGNGYVSLDSRRLLETLVKFYKDFKSVSRKSEQYEAGCCTLLANVIARRQLLCK